MQSPKSENWLNLPRSPLPSDGQVGYILKRHCDAQNTSSEYWTVIHWPGVGTGPWEPGVTPQKFSGGGEEPNKIM